MNKLFSIILGLFIVQSSLVFAEKLSVEDAQKFMHLSGLNESIAGLPEQVRQQLNLKRILEQDQTVYEKVSQVVEEAVMSVNAHQVALDYLLNRENSDGILGTMTFLESPLGQKVVGFENELNDQSSQMAMQQHMIEMSSNPPPQSRISLVHELNDALHMEQTMIDMIKGMMFAVVDIMKELKPELGEQVAGSIDQEWTQVEAILSKQFSQYATMASHYAYRELSDGELKQYIAFLRSPDGQVYWKASIDIYNLFLKAFIRNTIVKASELEG